MKVAINWSYIEASSVVVKVPNGTDLQELLNKLQPKTDELLTGDEYITVDEICETDEPVTGELYDSGPLPLGAMFSVREIQ